jgi:hypothetical protein
VSREFFLRFLSWSIFPQAPENNRVNSTFLKIGGDISKSRCTTTMNDTGCKFVAGVNYTGGKFSTSINDTGWYRWCRWYQWKIMVTISDCLHLKVNLRKKIIPYVISTTQRCQNKILVWILSGIFSFQSRRLLTKILKVEVTWKLIIQMLWSQGESHKTGVAKRTICISPP